MKIYREGAIGALLDEYEKAIVEFKNIILLVPDGLLTKIINQKSDDELCISLQNILTHVIHSGYGYACLIFNYEGNNLERPDKIFHTVSFQYAIEFDNLFTFTEKILKKINHNSLVQLNNDLKIKTGWGQLYDAEQLMEHAIVHILRHRRQVEKLISQHSH